MINEQIEYATMELTIISPLCITDGVKLIAKDYLYDPSTSTIYFINHLAWHKFIMKHGLFDKYYTYMAKKTSSQNLLNWLEENGYHLKDVQHFITGSSQAEVNILNPSDKKTVNDVFKQVRLTDGRIYIPGSSIKGYLRTAILFNLLKNNPAVRMSCWQELQTRFNGKAKSIEKCTKLMETNLLNKLQLKTEKGKPIKFDNAVCSITKGLQVSDAMPKGEITSAILQKIDEVRGTESKNNKLSVFRECILPNNLFTFTIKLDKSMFKLANINSIDELLKICAEFSRYTQNFYEQHFSNSYTYNDFNAFLGGNVGFLTKTLLYAMAPDEQKALDFTKNLLGCLFKNHKHFKNDTIIAPRTLKTTIYKGNQIQMGLAQMTKIK